MRINPSKNKQKRAFVSVAFVLFMLSTATTLMLLKTGILQDALDSASDTSKKQAPQERAFTFDTTVAPGWYAGPGNKTSQTVFRNGGNCFAMMVYEKGVYNEQVLLEKWEASALDRGVAFTAAELVKKGVKTTGGLARYTLHQRTLNVAANTRDVYQYEAVGYTALPAGYLRVEAYCNPVEGKTPPMTALNGFSLDLTVR